MSNVHLLVLQMNSSVKMHGINGVKTGKMCQTGLSNFKSTPGSSQIDVISITASVNLFPLNAVNAKFHANTLLKYSVIIIKKNFVCKLPPSKKKARCNHLLHKGSVTQNAASRIHSPFSGMIQGSVNTTPEISSQSQNKDKYPQLLDNRSKLYCRFVLVHIDIPWYNSHTQILLLVLVMKCYYLEGTD